MGPLSRLGVRVGFVGGLLLDVVEGDTVYLVDPLDRVRHALGVDLGGPEEPAARIGDAAHRQQGVGIGVTQAGQPLLGRAGPQGGHLQGQHGSLVLALVAARPGRHDQHLHAAAHIEARDLG